MKRSFLLLASIASISISSTSFAQRRPAQQHPPVAEQRGKPAVEVRYYYIPEYNAYFDAISKVYFYKKNNRWIKTGRPARINKNIGAAPREPLRDLKNNEMPYDHNTQHMQTWKGQQNQQGPRR